MIVTNKTRLSITEFIKIRLVETSWTHLWKSNFQFSYIQVIIDLLLLIKSLINHEKRTSRIIKNVLYYVFSNLIFAINTKKDFKFRNKMKNLFWRRCRRWHAEGRHLCQTQASGRSGKVVVWKNKYFHYYNYCLSIEIYLTLS